MTAEDQGSLGSGSSPTAVAGRDPSPGRPRREAPDRNLALELVRVTEAGAMAAGRWVGRGDKEGGDGAAVDAIRELVNSVSMRGVTRRDGISFYGRRIFTWYHFIKCSSTFLQTTPCQN